MSISNMFEVLRVFDGRRRLYRQVYGTPGGRAVLDDILGRCRMWREGEGRDREGRIDPLALAVAEGNREIATHILKHLGVSDVEMQLRLKNAQTTGESV